MSFVDELTQHLFKEALDNIDELPDTQVAKDPGRFGNPKIGYNPQADQIGKFWVVMHPTEESTEQDVVIAVDIQSLLLQAKGGLMPSDIAGVFKNEQDAKSFGYKLLADISNTI